MLDQITFVWNIKGLHFQVTTIKMWASDKNVIFCVKNHLIVKIISKPWVVIFSSFEGPVCFPLSTQCHIYLYPSRYSNIYFLWWYIYSSLLVHSAISFSTIFLRLKCMCIVHSPIFLGQLIEKKFRPITLKVRVLGGLKKMPKKVKINEKKIF